MSAHRENRRMFYHFAIFRGAKRKNDSRFLLSKIAFFMSCNPITPIGIEGGHSFQNKICQSKMGFLSAGR